MTKTLDRSVAAHALLPASCVPCRQRLDARPWARTLAVRAGDWVVGIRANTEATAELLETLLSGVRVPELDGEASANFSIELADAGLARTRQLHLVYQDHELVARRRDVVLVLRDLAELLDELDPLSYAGPLVRGVALLDEFGAAVLAPAHLRRPVLTRRAELESAGLVVSARRIHPLDPGQAELLVPEAPDINDVHEGLPERRTRRTERYRLRAWCVPVRGEGPRDLRRADGVYAAFGSVSNLTERGPAQTLSDLSAVARRTRFVGFPSMTPVTQVRSLLAVAH